MAPNPRRSGRTRIANTKYQSTGWDKSTLRLLRESSESSNPTSVESEVEEETAATAKSVQDDDDFDVDDQQREAVVDDRLSVDSRSEDSSNIATPERADNSGADPILSDAGEKVIKQARYHPAQHHSRGLIPVERGRSAKGGVWQYIFGPEVEDMEPVLRFKDRWLFKARDVSLPSRLTLQEARQDEWSHLGPTGAETRAPNVEKTTFGQAQKLSRISTDEAKARLFMVDHHRHQILLGPWSEQKVHDLHFQKPLDMGKAWLTDENVPGSPSYHSGWLLNIGEKPQCLAWAPRRGGDQFLAIACRSTARQRDSAGPNEATTSPAFSSSLPYPSSVFIWRISAIDRDVQGLTMDMAVAPQLTQVLACKFGDFKQITWISPGEHAPLDCDDSSVGLLAIVTTDGVFRILEVPQSPSGPAEVVCLEVHQPRLQIKPPPDAIFTCFDFASTTDLVLGLSSGNIHVYNIAHQFPSLTEMRPYLDIELHHTYVIALSVVDQSERSRFIVSSSANGTIRLTDLYCPYQDSVAIPRARIPSRNLIVVPKTYTIVTNLDNTGNSEPRGNAQTTIVGHNLRHFYTAQALSKFPEGGGTATVLAGSPLHPYILIANSGGTVWVQNAVRRIYPTGRAGSRTEGGAWVHQLADYEWIPKPQAPNPSGASRDSQHSLSASQTRIRDAGIDLYNGPAVRPGISRMNHGFRPEKLSLSNAASKKRKAVASGLDGEVAVQVIFEEEQAVTAVAWNPSPVAAGWAAMGWGSGVLWIADLSHDVV